jgi:stalled ribosome rescue protein Dom34
VTDHLDNIVALISDKNRHAGLHELEELAWRQIKSFTDQQKLKLVDEFKEKIGAGLAVYGIDAVWKAAREGKGFRMLVEKEYNGSAFITQEVDTVNEIMSTVLEKNGKIIIVEKDSLKNFIQIALINRY